MLELLAICALLLVGFAVVAFIAVAGFFLKILLKILLLPVGLLFGLLKVLFFGLLIVLAIALAPVVLALLAVTVLVVLPVLFFVGLFSAGSALAGA